MTLATRSAVHLGLLPLAHPSCDATLGFQPIFKIATFALTALTVDAVRLCRDLIC
jgi:hypothetical protein